MRKLACTVLLLFFFTSPGYLGAAPQNGMVYKFPLFQTAQPSTTGSSYNSFTNGLTLWDTVETTNVNVAGGDGPWTFDNWTITLTNAPGPGKSWTFTLRVNETDTPLSVTIADSATTQTDSLHSVTIRPGDRFDVKCVPQGAPTATGDMQRMIRITAHAPNRQLISTPSAISHPLHGGKTYYMAPDQRGNQNQDIAARAPWPAAGKISALYADLDTAPGAGESVAITLRKNAADTPLTCVISGAGKTCRDIARSVSISPGDVLDWSVAISAGSATTRPRIGAAFAPAINGQVAYIFESALLSAGTQYIAGEVAGSRGETRTLTMPAATVSNLFNDSEAGPGAPGQTDVLTVRRNKSDTALTCAVIGPATATHDTTHSVAFHDGDSLTVRFTATEGKLTVSKAAFLLFFPQSPAQQTPSQ